ncbi:MAG: polyphosphate kinase 1 [Calditrichaeota bacterium]|nr:polyphosphate kinase 1 [Calditrichota bacterium]
MAKLKLFDRELSWLSFNNRVLQECIDPHVPLYEKIKFMAIFSSNLDEFFRVRVASLRNLLNLKKDKKLKFTPKQLLKDIHNKVSADQQLLGKILKEIILPQLQDRNIFLINDSELNENQLLYAEQYFNNQILPFIKPLKLIGGDDSLFLQNKTLYLLAETKSPTDSELYLVEIPVRHTGRFILLPPDGKKKYVIFVDDILRLFIQKLFQTRKVTFCYSIKLTRDAEMYIDDEFSGNLLEKIKEGINRRKKGIPSRFLYDESMPSGILKKARTILELHKDDLVPGGRYHNFNDFFGFPSLATKKDFDKPQPALPCKDFDHGKNIFKVLSEKDVLIHFPYQTYDYVINFLNNAATDPLVTEIKITLYRVADPSKVIESLILAAQNGKSVTAFVELKARFDEESNIQGADALEEAGVKVLYSIPGIKVHSKICQVTRIENGGLKYYSYLATGNFNEKTAKVYSDSGLFTSNVFYTKDLNQVFAFLDGQIKEPEIENLLVAPFNMRPVFEKLIKNEISNARKGRPSGITIKLNSLQDPEMIKLLYKASKNGVPVKIIVRGICCLIPGAEGLSENIEVLSIIDRYLEHARYYIFENNGNPMYLMGSADWMTRNLKRRVEVIFPIIDNALKKEIQHIIDLQWQDNKKARLIDPQQNNDYKPQLSSKPARSQQQVYNYIKRKNR